MKKVFSAILSMILTATAVFCPVFADEVSGSGNANCVQTTFFGEVCDEGDGSAIKGVVSKAVGIMTGLVAVLAVIGVIVFGIQYATAGGNEAKMVKAKNRIVEIVIGLVIWAVMWAALNWLVPGFRLEI